MDLSNYFFIETQKCKMVLCPFTDPRWMGPHTSTGDPRHSKIGNDDRFLNLVIKTISFGGNLILQKVLKCVLFILKIVFWLLHFKSLDSNVQFIISGSRPFLNY